MLSVSLSTAVSDFKLYIYLFLKKAGYCIEICKNLCGVILMFIIFLSDISFNSFQCSFAVCFPMSWHSSIISICVRSSFLPFYSVLTSMGNFFSLDLPLDFTHI